MIFPIKEGILIVIKGLVLLIYKLTGQINYFIPFNKLIKNYPTIPDKTTINNAIKFQIFIGC